MAYLASQKRSELHLSSSAAVLQVVTIDELQLVTGQTKGLQCHSSMLPNIMVNVLASWMISGAPGVAEPSLLLNVEDTVLRRNVTSTISDWLQEYKGMWV